MLNNIQLCRKVSKFTNIYKYKFIVEKILANECFHVVCVMVGHARHRRLCLNPSYVIVMVVWG